MMSSKVVLLKQTYLFFELFQVVVVHVFKPRGEGTKILLVLRLSDGKRGKGGYGQ